MSKAKMLIFAAATIAAVSCRSFDCSGTAACGGSTAASAPRPSYDPLDNNFFKSAFKQSKKRRSAEAQFHQNYATGSISTNYDCRQGGCTGGATPNINPTYNSATNYIQTPQALFNQDFMAGSQAFNTVNGGGKKKRSTEPDADPGFHQTFQSGSQSQNFDCTGIYGCYPPNHNQANGANYHDYYDYDYYNQANITNPGFDQTYKAGSQYENIDSSGSTTGKITVAGGGHNSDVSHSGINSNENVLGDENPCVKNNPCGINTSCHAEPTRISCKCLPGFKQGDSGCYP